MNWKGVDIVGGKDLKKKQDMTANTTTAGYQKTNAQFLSDRSGKPMDNLGIIGKRGIRITKTQVTITPSDAKERADDPSVRICN